MGLQCRLDRLVFVLGMTFQHLHDGTNVDRELLSLAVADRVDMAGLAGHGKEFGPDPFVDVAIQVSRDVGLDRAGLFRDGHLRVLLVGGPVIRAAH